MIDCSFSAFGYHTISKSRPESFQHIQQHTSERTRTRTRIGTAIAPAFQLGPLLTAEHRTFSPLVPSFPPNIFLNPLVEIEPPHCNFISDHIFRDAFCLLGSPGFCSLYLGSAAASKAILANFSILHCCLLQRLAYCSASRAFSQHYYIILSSPAYVRFDRLARSSNSSNTFRLCFSRSTSSNRQPTFSRRRV